METTQRSRNGPASAPTYLHRHPSNMGWTQGKFRGSQFLCIMLPVLSPKGLLRQSAKMQRDNSFHHNPQHLAILVSTAQGSLVCTQFLFPEIFMELSSTLRPEALSQICRTHLEAVVPLGVG